MGKGLAEEHRYPHDPWMWTTMWGLPEGVVGWVKGENGGKIGTTVIA